MYATINISYLFTEPWFLSDCLIMYQQTESHLQVFLYYRKNSPTCLLGWFISVLAVSDLKGKSGQKIG